MKFEERAYKFFKNAAEKAKSEKVKRLFEAIAKEEEMHKELLEAEGGICRNLVYGLTIRNLKWTDYERSPQVQCISWITSYNSLSPSPVFAEISNGLV
ncbi:MAG: hypothetical protein FE047_02240 [Thermoplasmata archaeon]|nr:MAG: hypothetical protein FE047_02240 [Thermoplasmata archaeon]